VNGIPIRCLKGASIPSAPSVGLRKQITLTSHLNSSAKRRQRPACNGFRLESAGTQATIFCDCSSGMVRLLDPKDGRHEAATTTRNEWQNLARVARYGPQAGVVQKVRPRKAL
jgi:hypothetical protein